MKMLMLSVVMLVLAVAGCSSSLSSSPDIPETDYVGAAEDVAPAFTAPVASLAASFAKADEGGQWGYRAFEIAVLFAKKSEAAEYGTGNIYNNVNTAQNVFDDFRVLTDLADYAFETPFVEPFFDDIATYQYAGNYFAEAEDDEVNGGSAVSNSDDGMVSVLSTSGRSATADSGEERSSMKASYSDTSKSLTLDVVQYVDYGQEVYEGLNTGKFIMRMYVEGNSDSHTFDALKVIKYNSTEGAYYLNIVGKGISQGADNYFLFRITDVNGSDRPASTNGYFCIAAGNLTANTDFSTPKTEEQIAATDCAMYLEDVKAMVPFETEEDLPTEAFDVSIPGNPKVFVMEMNPLPSP
jgi:hypothetical protein